MSRAVARRKLLSAPPEKAIAADVRGLWPLLLAEGGLTPVPDPTQPDLIVADFAELARLLG